MSDAGSGVPASSPFSAAMIPAPEPGAGFPNRPPDTASRGLGDDAILERRSDHGDPTRLAVRSEDRVRDAGPDERGLAPRLDGVPLVCNTLIL